MSRAQPLLSENRHFFFASGDLSEASAAATIEPAWRTPRGGTGAATAGAATGAAVAAAAAAGATAAAAAPPAGAVTAAAGAKAGAGATGAGAGASAGTAAAAAATEAAAEGPHGGAPPTPPRRRSTSGRSTLFQRQHQQHTRAKEWLVRDTTPQTRRAYATPRARPTPDPRHKRKVFIS